jgi:hypothetical protein
VGHLQQRLGAHFPTLRAGTWPQALADYQPDLWLVGSAVVLAETDLTQLAHFDMTQIDNGFGPVVAPSVVFYR